MKERDYRPQDALVPIISVAALTLLTQYAFSRDSRRAIIRRDGGCVASGQHEGGLEAAHIDHNKSNPRYDDPSNGRAMCTKHHLQDHINRHGHNGLPEHQNKWAIRAIKSRLSV